MKWPAILNSYEKPGKLFKDLWPDKEFFILGITWRYWHHLLVKKKGKYKFFSWILLLSQKH